MRERSTRGVPAGRILTGAALSGLLLVAAGGCDPGEPRNSPPLDAELLGPADASAPLENPDLDAGHAADPDAGASASSDAGPVASAPDAGAAQGPTCADIFNQDVLQTYSFEISPDEWARMDAEFHNLAAVHSAVPFVADHPIVFHFNGETIADATVHLKGQSSWVQTVMFDGPKAKMQFVIDFNNVNPNGSFHGLSALRFDMPRTDWTFLHERLSYAWMRQIGIPAPCANSGRLEINGAYYGLYAVEEDIGHHLIKEYFPNDSDGDLWKGGQELKTNKKTPNRDRLRAFWAARDIPSMTAIIDLPSSILEWAAEAMLNDADGYWGGAHNFYIYDQGAPGFVFLPTDTDSTFDYLGRANYHPFYWWVGRSGFIEIGQHYLAVINDPTWRARFADAIATQLGRWDVAEIQSWVDAWSGQIAGAVADDSHKWANVSQFQQAVSRERAIVKDRAAFVQTWVDCERGAANLDDADGDGVRWCEDCNEGNAAVHPGAPEICGNNVDDNCNGATDEGC